MVGQRLLTANIFVLSLTVWFVSCLRCSRFWKWWLPFMRSQTDGCRKSEEGSCSFHEELEMEWICSRFCGILPCGSLYFSPNKELCVVLSLYIGWSGSTAGSCNFGKYARWWAVGKEKWRMNEISLCPWWVEM